MRFVLVLLALFITNAVTAQENHAVYKTSNPTDTTEILVEIRNGGTLKTIDFDSSIYLLQEALTQSRKINYANGIASALVYLGLDYNFTGRTKESLPCFQQAIPYAKKSGYNKELLATLYAGIGTPYLSDSKYGMAAYYYYKALQDVENNHLQHTELAAHLYLNIANLWRRMNQYSYAMSYMLKSKKIAITNNDSTLLLSVYGNIGALYELQNDTAKALAYMNATYNLAVKKKIIIKEQMTLNNIGTLLANEKKWAQAIPYFQKVLLLTDDEHAYRHNLGTYYNLASCYYTLHNYGSAQKYALYAVHQSDRLGIGKEDMTNALLVLANTYQREKNYKETALWLGRYIDYTDSTTIKHIDSNINSLEVNYELSEKDKVIAQNQLLLSIKEIQLKNKNISIISVTAGVLLLSIVLFVLYLASKHKQSIQAGKIKSLQQEKELGYLKAVLEGEEKERTRLARELHDGIGGMLVSAKLNLGTFRKENVGIENMDQLDSVMALLTDTTTEIRQTAHNLMPDVLIKNSLQEALLFYCSNINGNKQLDIDLQFHGELNQLDKSAELILYRITQELIQNIIKHAEATQAVIQIIQDNGRLNLIIEDNGSGFDVENYNKGFGMQNLQFRVQALQGYISITSEKGKGTSVYIEFNLEKLKTV